MGGGRNNKRLRPAVKRVSADAEAVEFLKQPTKKLFKIDKNQPLIASALSGNISTSPADESHLRLLREGKRCDVTFLVGPSNERIQCHQLFLMARSTVFETMFSDRWNEGTKEIEIPDVDPEVFRAFLKFLYSDKLMVSLTSALDLLYVAQKYDVQLLVQKCEDLLKVNLTLEECVEVMQAARAYGHEAVMKIAGDLMATATSLEPIASEKVLTEMDKETLIYLLNRDDLRVKEVELFRIALEWGKTQVKLGTFAALEEALADVLALVRFPIMTLNEFTTVVLPAGLLKQDDLMQMYTYFGSNKDTRKEIVKELNFNINPRKAAVTGVVVAFYDGTIGPFSTRIYDVIDEMKFRAAVTCNLDRKYADLVKKPKELAITGIILHCPSRDSNNLSRGENLTLPSTHDYYKVSISQTSDTYCNCNACERERYSDNEPLTLIISPVKLEWESEMEVKVEPPVPLKDRHQYLILLEKAQKTNDPYIFRSRTFGQLKVTTEVELESHSLKLTQFRSKPANSNIIHTIRVVEQ